MMAIVARTIRGKQKMETRMGDSTVEGEAREYHIIRYNLEILYKTSCVKPFYLLELIKFKLWKLFMLKSASIDAIFG